MILRASYGTLGLLGINKVRVSSQRVAYFMLDGRCVFDCAYCTHAASSNVSSEKLSRMIWKVMDPEEAVEKVNESADVKRVCLQVVSYRDYRKNLENLIPKFNKKVSVSVRALSLEEVMRYYELGADIVSVPLDIVNPLLYKKYRGGKLEKTLSLIEEVSKSHPKRIATHIIIGMGETEKEVVEMMDHLYQNHVIVALFAFTPIKGTELQDHKRPEIESYRRIQIARWLLEKKMVTVKDFSFNENGEIVDFGVDIEKHEYKKAFLTSGCPDCTRPFYNESPGKELYNIHDEKLVTQLPDLSWL